MSTESDILTGFASLLASANVATYKPTGGYLPTDTAIVFGELPTAPDRAVALALYTSSDEVKENLSEFRLQCWFRGNPNNSLDAGNLASDVFDAVQGLEGLTFGAAFVIQIQRVSFVPQGVDALKRYERSDNYLVQVNTPLTAGRTY